ncbi:MAG TPA: M1 family metallopeptidase [Chthoniobacteraceae bacterium]|jgi:aminopeptidase N
MRAVLSLIVVFLLTVPGLAEAPFSFEKTPGQLPKTIVPRHYALRLAPNIGTASFTGSETIEIEVRQPVREIVLNSLGLEITKAVLHDSGRSRALIPKLDPTRQTLTFSLAEELPAGSCRLDLEFSGKLNEQTLGLYIARYQVGSEQKKALATQMEATDARRMFPCWDEPVFRATFQLDVIVPDNLEAVSNMPIRDSVRVAGGKNVSFEKTPSMATYLVALFIGEFEALEDEVDGVKLRALTTPGKREQARYALEATKLLLPYFNEYFGTKYPLPKLDQIALPSTGASGMENWGAIVYNDTAFLYDPATSSQSTKERVFEVVAHEIAHQWFGDLVTMSWWDNLWLNEGFASWMGTKATDKFNPEWQVWLRAAEGKEWAMSLDARSTTRAIQQPIATEAQANDAFDEITYQKGQAFIRMLESYLGEEAFRAGLRQYMKQHAYSSTTSADLWKTLEDASGKPVRTLAAGWTEQPGFPVIKLSLTADGASVEISQERFTLNQTQPKPLFWAVPLALGPAGAPLSSSVALLKETRIAAFPIEPGQALKANIGDVGYYRVWYDDALFKRLYKTSSMMATADQLNLLNDAWAMSLAERAPVARYLDLVASLGESSAYVIIDQIIGTFWTIDHLQRGQPGEAAFHRWAKALLQPHLARLGWEAKSGEKQLDGLLRTALVSQLGQFGDEAVLVEAQRRFAAFLEKPESLPGDLRGAVLGLIGRRADAATWEKLHALGKAESSTEQKRLLYRALASTHSPELAGKALALSLSNELVPRQATGIVRTVGTAGEQPVLALDFARKNLDALLAKLGALDANEFVPNLFRPFTDAARAEELEAFAKAQLPPDAQPQVAKVADQIRFNALLKTRLLPDIDAWCRARSGN